MDIKLKLFLHAFAQSLGPDIDTAKLTYEAFTHQYPDFYIPDDLVKMGYSAEAANKVFKTKGELAMKANNEIIIALVAQRLAQFAENYTIEMLDDNRDG